MLASSLQSETAFTELLARAHQERDQQALGRLLQDYRPYLLQIAAEELDPHLRAKEAASDLVQRSFLEATQGFERFAGTTPEVLRAWLRQILRNNLNELRGRYQTNKREIKREAAAAENRLLLVAPGSGPSPSDAAMQQEQELAQAAALAAGLNKLALEARTLITLRHREGRSFPEIAQQLKISEEAARKRWARAVEELRELVRKERDSSGG